MSTGGFLIPQEFVTDLAFVFGREILQKRDPDFVLPQLPEYVALQQKIEYLPRPLRCHFMGYQDLFVWPDWWPLEICWFMSRVTSLLSHTLFGNLQKQWQEVRDRQRQMEYEIVQKSLRDLGYSVDNLTQMYQTYLRCE